MTNPTRIPVSAPQELGESPVWIAPYLYWTDIHRGEIHRYDETTGAHERRQFDGAVSCIAPVADSRWLVAVERRLLLFDWETGATREIARLDVPEHIRFNDGKCDPLGRLVIGTMSKDLTPRVGALYRLDRDRLAPLISELTISNGIGWSEDGSVMYHVDTSNGRIDAWEYQVETGTPRHRRTVIQFSETVGVPDGLTVDCHGNIWVALWGGACVVNLDPSSGRELERIELPVPQPTSCCFGGASGCDLYVTSAFAFMKDAARDRYPDSGAVFKLETGTKAGPLWRWKEVRA